MTRKTKEDILYPIADVFTMTLNESAGKITGGATLLVPVMNGCDVTVPMKVEDSFFRFNARQAAVLVHMGGDLYMLCIHNAKPKGISVFVLNGKKLYSEGNKKSLRSCTSLKEVIKTVKDAVIASFMRSTYDNKWEPFSIEEK